MEVSALRFRTCEIGLNICLSINYYYYIMRFCYDLGFALEFLCIEFPIHSWSNLFSVLSLSYSSFTVSIRSNRAILLILEVMDRYGYLIVHPEGSWPP